MKDRQERPVSADDFEVLIVDDDKGILKSADEYLSLQGYRVTTCERGLEALDLVKERDFAIVFTDLKMPEFSGLELLAAIKEHSPQTEVIIMTGYGTIESAIEALRLGSYDYLQKPIKLERLKILIDRIIEKRKLEKENIFLKRRLEERHQYGELVGISPRMREIFDIIARISSNSPTVFIQGESGTGKEVVARVIHENSTRQEKPFVAVNCGAIVEGLLESELFGHIKGAFTGAIRDKVGLFEAARGGTLFLDEVAEITPALQVKLLRALQEKRVRPVGDTKELDIDVRVIAATNRDPEEAVKTGRLRSDLFYRLNVVPIQLPLLRERKQDIPLLSTHFLSKLNRKPAQKPLTISTKAMDRLLEYPWPGNVRELENVIERAYALGVREKIEVSDLPLEIRRFGEGSKKSGRIYNLKENEVALIEKALRKTKGKKGEAASLLGINTTTLYRKIKKYGIEEGLLQKTNE